MPRNSNDRRRRGRPKTHENMQRVTIWLPLAALRMIDSVVQQNPIVFRDRSDLIRNLITRGLATDPTKLAQERLGSLKPLK